MRQKRQWMARDRRNPEPVRPDLRGPTGVWLSGFPWDWYATMTFAEPVHPEQAARRWQRWVRDLEEQQEHRVRWARALEYQKRGVIHDHALVWFGGADEARRLTGMDRWEVIGQGYARIVTYDPHLGATHYLGKYVAKGGEIDLGGQWWRRDSSRGAGAVNHPGKSPENPPEKAV
jgi:hypothetical protein